MKLKAIGAITNKVKQLILLDAGPRQWVGDGYAFYLLPESLGQLTEKTACAIFDIPEEKAAAWRMKRQEMPDAFDTTDEGTDEEIVVYDTFRRIMFNGYDMLPATSGFGKTYFLQAKYMKPLTDADPVLALRYTRKGTPYFVAKEGMFAEAIIMPMKSTPDLAQWMTGTINGMENAKFYEQHEIGTDEEDGDR
jgi:hypothetical protein